MKQTVSFVPANISCIFKIHKGESPETTGSTGVGFTLDKGVHARVEESDKTEVFFNGEKITINPISDVIKKLTKLPLKISLISEFALGYGFGISGAATLATAYAINDALGLKKEKLELAKIAHICEVESGTGLGDIINQYFGGFLLKVKPSFLFEAINLQIADVSVYCKSISTLETKSIIQKHDLRDKINAAAEIAMKKIEELLVTDTISFAKVIEASKEFALKSGLLQDEEVLKEIQHIEERGGHASMMMLGNGVFSDSAFEGSKEYKIQ